jgi:hypothetical protein
MTDTAACLVEWKERLQASDKDTRRSVARRSIVLNEHVKGSGQEHLTQTE